MRREVIRCIDIDNTLSLEQDYSLKLSEQGKVASDEGFYTVENERTYNVALVEALLATQTDQTSNILFSTVDMLQSDRLDGQQGLDSYWHAQRGVLRLRFYQLLELKGLDPQGLISTSCLLHDDPFQQGHLLMRNERVVADEREVAFPLSKTIDQRFPLPYTFESDEHRRTVTEDFYNTTFVVHLLKWAVTRDIKTLDHKKIVESLREGAEGYDGLIEELKQKYGLFSILRTEGKNDADFVEEFKKWVKEHAIDSSDYLANLNNALDFFHKIDWSKSQKKNLQDRVKLFLSGKGCMLAHKFYKLNSASTIQVLDDKTAVIELCKLIAKSPNLLGERKLQAMQVSDAQWYHSKDCYELFLKQSESNENLVLDFNDFKTWIVEKTQQGALDSQLCIEQIVRGRLEEIQLCVHDDTKCVVTCLEATEFQNDNSLDLPDNVRYKIIYIKNSNHIYIYDKKLNFVYQRPCESESAAGYLQQYVSCPPQFRFVDRLNKAWSETFGLKPQQDRRQLQSYFINVTSNQPFFSKAYYVARNIISGFLKLLLEMLPYGIECVLNHAREKVSEKKWHPIVKTLLKVPLYLNAIAFKIPRVIARAVLSPVRNIQYMEQAIVQAASQDNEQTQQPTPAELRGKTARQAYDSDNRCTPSPSQSVVREALIHGSLMGGSPTEAQVVGEQPTTVDGQTFSPSSRGG